MTTMLRSRIGIVPQKAVLFAGTIVENLRWGKKDASKEEMWKALEISQSKEFVEKKDGQLESRIEQGGKNLSGGQRQRLTIARALVRQPEILILDDSASALDPISTMKIEDLMADLREKYTVVIVTHNMQQAARISDDLAFFLVGEMVEFGETEQLFSMPKDKRTEDYITGRFG